MRFFETGPSIPDSLLERCDRGHVVFFCGAGVSIPSGMPDFVKLTQYVVDFFDPPEDSAIATAFAPWLDDKYSGRRVPLDQIFNLLHHEYGREEVNALVAQCLSSSKASKQSREHSLIARISSDPEGRPQIITTNFDHLFDNCPGVTTDRIFEPPEFPDIEFGRSVHGVVHLHGRLKEQDGPHHDYVLSSSDFGRAYLAEGWATKFMRALLDKYTVVLIGYQAEDPPVDYLLQGLNYGRERDRSNLYAFDKGAFEDIEVKWRDQGVTPIAYNNYADLWKTLEVWADRTDDPRAWRNGVVKMANHNPRNLCPFERGQVAHLVRSTPGARLFAQSEPSPPAEWLCVFDANCRAPKESWNFEENLGKFDPSETYRLDDDPERRHEAEQHGAHTPDQLIGWRYGDTNPPEGHTLAGRQVDGQENLPPRLFHLLYWSSKHLNDPWLAWWATKYTNLHPRHINRIRQQIRNMDNLHSRAKHTWNLILEAMADKRNSAWDKCWYDLSERIKSDGWTLGTLRSFDETMGPILSYRSPFDIAEARPPVGTWENVHMNKIADWEITFPDHHDETLHIPDHVLLEVFQIAERHLRRAADLHRDIDTNYFTTPNCYPDREVDGKTSDSDDNDYFRWFIQLIRRMSDRHAKELKSYVLAWNHKDRFYFRKLKLFVFNDPQVFKANEAAELVLEFDQDDFWDNEVRRELLFLLADRWSNFTFKNRFALERRLLAGPKKMEHCPDEDYPIFRDKVAACYARWLEFQGCKLTRRQSFLLAEMIDRIPDWTDGWANGVVIKHGANIDFCESDHELGSLTNVPVGKVIELAKAESDPDYETFTDIPLFVRLVKSNPIKALAALCNAKKQDEYPVDLWRSLIQNWPNDVFARPNWVFWYRLSSLPHETMRALAHPLAVRIKSELKNLYAEEPKHAWQIFDKLVAGIISEGGSPINNANGESFGNSEVDHSSRRTYEQASNNPIGKITEGWVDILYSLKLEKAHGIPLAFKTRLEHLLDAPSEGRDHVVAIISLNIGWFHYLEPDWVLNQILPWFNFDHPMAEPAWNGYLSAAKLPPQEIGEQLKPMLLNVFPAIYKWNWDRGLATIAVQMIIELSIFRTGKPDGLTFKEAHQCIRDMSDENRRGTILHLRKIGKQEDGWNKHVIPFIENAWPLEKKFRTTEMVFAWISLLADTDNDFPVVLKSVRRFLVAVERRGSWLYPFSGNLKDKNHLASKHPTAVLEMLDAVIPNNSQTVPPDLESILYLIEAADPALAKDRRFLRLIDLVEQG